MPVTICCFICCGKRSDERERERRGAEDSIEDASQGREHKRGEANNHSGTLIAEAREAVLIPSVECSRRSRTARHCTLYSGCTTLSTQRSLTSEAEGTVASLCAHASWHPDVPDLLLRPDSLFPRLSRKRDSFLSAAATSSPLLSGHLCSSSRRWPSSPASGPEACLSPS